MQTNNEKDTHKNSIDNLSFSEECPFLFENYSEEKLVAEFKNSPPRACTGFRIGGINLDFPAGAMSIIVAPTSHGKTTSLINFALGYLKNTPEKSVTYFSYKERAESIITRALSAYIKQELSRNNKDSIENYFRYGMDEFIKEDKRADFKKGKEEFFSKLIDTGRLKISDLEMTAEELIEAIKYLKNNTSVGLIIIDCIHLLSLESNNSYRGRHEEIKQICLMLKDCAISTGLPIVLVAQFNRYVKSKEDMHESKISETADIENLASLIIGIYKDKDNIEINFKVLKGRDVGSGYEETMYFNGNVGLLTYDRLEQIKNIKTEYLAIAYPERRNKLPRKA